MAHYTGSVPGISPSLADDNWTLDAGASESGKIIEVSWGGEVVVTTAMQTRVARSSAAAGAGTAGNITKIHPNSPAALIDFFTTYATTQPTLDAGDLFATSWNAHGGVVRWLAAPGEEFILIGAATISCRNGAGIGLSSYHTVWAED